jgi:hypothetical protein
MLFHQFYTFSGLLNCDDFGSDHFRAADRRSIIDHTRGNDFPVPDHRCGGGRSATAAVIDLIAPSLWTESQSNTIRHCSLSSWAVVLWMASVEDWSKHRLIDAFV